jgi:bis(5'-nucleosyl)-tetraphosphatase (symmetrical)
MAHYLIGDVQGCDAPLERLLAKLAFSPSRDTIYVLGDLVNRGPSSASVLRRLAGYGHAARCLLGNHDLSLLATAAGYRAPKGNDTLDDILGAPDREAMLAWLRHRSMAIHAHGILMVHGGVLPQWDLSQTLALAGEVEAVLRGPELTGFLAQMWGNQPDRWDDALTGVDRLRLVVNALTRLRFCTPEGVMDLKASGGLDAAPPGTMAWFDVPGRRTADACIAFGHWSTLGYMRRPDILALDTGCVWGGCLSALRLDESGAGAHELVQEACEQSQAPGE